MSKIKPGRTGGVFVETDAGEPQTFNFLLAEDDRSMKYLGMLFESLVLLNPLTNEIEPALAKSWEIGADQKTFTFHLRRGLQWSDGQPLTADDVLFTFQSIYDPRYPSRLSTDLSDGEKPFQVTKIDEWTVQIRTEHIYAPFLVQLSGLLVVPKHVLQRSFDDGSLEKIWTASSVIEHPEAMVVSGAFRIHSYRPGERLVLEPNPYYYRVDSEGHRLPLVDFMICKTVKDANQTALSFAAGETDFLETIDPNDVDWVQAGAAQQGCSVQSLGPSTRCNFIWFNQNPGKSKSGRPFVDPVKLAWFQNTKFRQAVSYGIDRQGIVNGVLFGRGRPLWGFDCESNHAWFNPQVSRYPYDPAKASELLKEAGFVRDGKILRDQAGNPVEFNLYTNHENQIRMNMATVFKENMLDLGITVRLQFIEFNAFVEKITDSYDYEAGMLGFTGGSDPSGGMSIFLSSGRLHQWYPNQPKPATPWEARIDELMIAQLRTLNYSERRKCYDEVQQIMSDQCPFIYLITPESYVGLKTKWQNLQPTIWDPHLWNPEQLWSVQ